MECSLITSIRGPSFADLRTRWQRRLQTDFEEEDWIDIVNALDRGTREACLAFCQTVGTVLCDSVALRQPFPTTLILLHDMGDLPDLSRPQRHLLHTALAKIFILRHWRLPSPPTSEEWIVAVTRAAVHEPVIYNLQDQAAIQVWAPFLSVDS
ncbi:hypothetical protein NDU88_003581 [Pleurodeles waltl]|uniref:Uncharacterized protein n=1 Tax=Pleurodeles waltl TaxID=8319 RepID=A0AAV7MR51_PLEWA|nr:hypothetical protein NDU88_003581 [Pleurodeles waltl]